MARGIWENSLTKIFLTRSFLGPIFRPFLYSAEEYMHYNFLEEITRLTQQIIKIRNLEKRGLTYYWLIEVPRSLFEELFISGIEKQSKYHSLYKIKAKNGTEIAYLTQGYILAILPWLLKQDKSLDVCISPSMEELEQIVFTAYGSENRIFYYQHYFQQLLIAFFAEETNEEIVRLYIEKVNDCITDIPAIQNSHYEIRIHQDTVNFCLWKLQNIRSSVTTMVKLLGENKISSVPQASSKETNY